MPQEEITRKQVRRSVGKLKEGKLKECVVSQESCLR